MTLRKYIILLIIIITSIAAKAQVFSVNGTVLDSVTKQKLAFVNITVNDDGKFGTATDIDGKFSISSKQAIESITFSYVGYKKKTVTAGDLNHKSNKISLQPVSIQLQEVVFRAGENPAHRIIDSVVRNRRRNNPEMLDSYQYTIYDRMIVTVDTTQVPDSVFADFGRLWRNNDLMVMETVSEQYHKRPGKNKREIKANKISGLKNPEYFYILDGMQSAHFYDDFITVYEKSYVNPITPGSKSRYFFGLESVMPTATGDSLYVISFKPRRGTTFNALKGVMTVTSDGWAIVNVKAEAADKTNTLDVKIQQLYEKVNDSIWFPVQLNTDIIFIRMIAQDNAMMISANTPEKNNTSLNGIGKSYIRDIKINDNISNKVFRSTDIDMAKDSGEKDETFWSQYRSDSINERILNTYHFVDTIVEDSGIDFDQLMDGTKTLLTEGAIPWGAFNIGLSDIMNYNIGNGFYLGLGAKTNAKLSKTIRFGGYFGYWFGPTHINCGGNIDLMIDRRRDLQLKLNFDHRYNALGDYGFMSGAYNPLDESFFKYYYIKWTTLNTTASAELSTRFAKICRAFATFSLNDKEMYDWYTFNNNGVSYNKQFRVTTVDFKLRIAPGERYMLTSKGMVTVNPGKPVIWLSYQKGLKGLLDCPFNYDKIQFQISHTFQTRYFGKTKLTLQAGYVTGDVPLFENFNIFANKTNFGLYSTESFATMDINEFICDRFVVAFLSHNFGKFFKTKYFSPDFIVETNVGWGDIQDIDKHEGLELKSMKDGYYESGLVLDNVYKIMFCKLGLGAYYRYGANSFEKGIDNCAFKLKMSIGF